MIRLREFESVTFAGFMIARQNELPDVLAIGGGVVVAQQGQSLAFFGQLRSQSRSGFPGGTLRLVFEIRVDQIGRASCRERVSPYV